jgi:hypothetical protein
VDGLAETARTGKTGADIMLDDYVNKWGMNVDKIYDAMTF